MSILTSTESELDFLILEDLEFETPCDGASHPTEEGRNYGHVAADPATHQARCPGCSHVSLLCAGNAMWLWSQPSIYCKRCTFTGPPLVFDIHRIPGK